MSESPDNPSTPRPAASDSEPLPLEPLSSPAPPRPAIDLPPLESMSEHTCPNCGAPMALNAVVCTKCGLDLREGRKREIETGEAPPPEVEVARPEFLTPTRLSPNVHAVIGAGCTIGAMIAAGINAPGNSTWIALGKCGLTLYETIVHTGTGIVAVAIAARLSEHRFSRVDLAAARMFLAFSAFQLLIHLRIAGVPPFVSGAILSLAAGAAYFVCIMALLKKEKEQTLMVVGLHFVLWLLFESGIMLASWVSHEIAILPRNV